MYDPPKRALAGENQNSFAYVTLKDRLPVILTKIVDTVSRYAHMLTNSKLLEESRTIIASLSRLRYELQCNKELEPIQGSFPDTFDEQVWNKQLAQFPDKRWFSVPWLFVECYMYRRVAEAFKPWWGQYDWFATQKHDSFAQHADEIETSAAKFLELVLSDNMDIRLAEVQFMSVLQASLWGNQVDLSMHAGKSKTEISRHSDLKSASQTHIISDHSRNVWEHISKRTIKGEVHVILDNAGAELFQDLCLADWLVANKVCSSVTFHCKMFPWFVSDVTKTDFMWLLKELSARPSGSPLAVLGNRWNAYMEAGTWNITDNIFWNSYHAYAHLKEAAPELYKQFQSADLCIFKGDLNYRKLVYDCEWPYPYTVSFQQALGALAGSMPLVTLRPGKADVVVGLPEGQAEKLDAEAGKNVREKGWLVSGQYGVIQFCPKHHQEE